MLKPARMKKFRLIYHKKINDKVIATLHEEGIVQLKEISELEVVRKKMSEETLELSNTIAKFREMEDVLGRPSQKPVVVKEVKFEEALLQAKKILAKFGPKVNNLKAKKEEFESRRQKILSQIDFLEKFSEVKVPLRYLRSTEDIRVTVGAISEEKLEQLFATIKESAEGRVFTSAIGAGKRRTVVIACRAKDYPRISPIIYRFEIEILNIPDFSGVSSVAVRKMKAELNELNTEENRFYIAVKKYKKEAALVSQTKEVLEINKERLDASEIFGYTESTVIVEGWVPEKKAQSLERTLDSATNGRSILLFHVPKSEEAESVPVELENPAVVKDFEYVTGMYGPPRYDEVDPTPFLAFSFALFFGLALADVGYGIAITLFMASGIWLSRIFSSKLRRMMILCGIFTIIGGLLIGGWFGIGQGLWVNPIVNPVPLLKLVIIIGIVHILIALGIMGFLKDLFRRDWKSLLFTRISPVILIIGFFGLSFSALGIGLSEFGTNYSFPKMEVFEAFNPFSVAPLSIIIFRSLFYFGLLGGVVGAAITAKGVKGKIGNSLNSIYALTGYISDVASYSRIMALGIAGGVIAFSINLILGLVYNGIKPLPAPIAILLTAGLVFVFLIAHAFNIFISSLGAFIHTMRLHFMEFFSKFYESGGERFVPFKVKRSVTKLKEVR